jgi:hypothetical protein
MFTSVCAIGIILFVFTFAFSADGQQVAASTPAATADLPNLVRFSGKATDPSGKPLTGVVGITFALYEQETGGSSLWIETQNVQLDATGHYTALLGVTKPDGLPAGVFVSGQARWVGAQLAGQAEQPRVMLLAVPYAMKAGDAATVGGLPPSAFMLAVGAVSNGSPATTAATSRAADSALPAASSNVTTTGGTVKMLPLWTTGTNIQSSVVTQTGTGSTARIGILNTAPSATLDVTGGATIRGLLNLPNA